MKNVMSYYTKIFKDNRSSYPKSHREPIYRLIELHHPMVPNIFSVDDKQITYEYVEGIPLKDTDMKSVEDMMWVLSSCMDFMNALAQVRKEDLFLFAEDMHALNIIVTPDRQLKIIDLDQIGFYSKANVYRYLNRNYFYLVDFFRCRNYT